jgi:molybdopterin converting factor subunit 1
VRVKVLLFARLRDLAGAGELDVDVPPGATIRQAWDALATLHASVAPYAGSLSCARNAEYARWDTALAEGDEVAFLPPVSGGAPHL